MNINKLVLKGYFPVELTPAFVTHTLCDVLEEIIVDLDTYDSLARSGKITKFVPYSTPRIKGYRRNISIPNPLPFIRLSNTICENWIVITDFTNQSRISLSPLKIDTKGNRAIQQPSFDHITKERILRSTGYRYLLKIDIQKFYGTIYTHSIPWALHSKADSKMKRRRSELIGNAIDIDVRKMQDGQTIGIPIGPDTSRIISEIIVSKIDIELQKQLPNIKGIRVVDDYSLYFKKLSDLETAKAVILRLLKDFELDLNQAKDKLIELPEVIESEWYNRLRIFEFRNHHDLQHKDLIAYFDLCFLLSVKFPEDAILSYGISKISATIFKKENWQVLEAFLLKSLFVEPKVLPHIIRIFISHKKEGYTLDFNLINETIEEFLVYHLNLDNHFEIAWGLWLFKQLEIEVSNNVAKLLGDNANSVVALTALDLFASGLIPIGLDTSNWRKLLKGENLYTEHWLLVYESIKKGWLSVPTDFIARDPFFNFLKENNVEFYDPTEELDLSKIKVTAEDVSLLKYKESESTEKDYLDPNDESDLDLEELNKFFSELGGKAIDDDSFELSEED